MKYWNYDLEGCRILWIYPQWKINFGRKNKKLRRFFVTENLISRFFEISISWNIFWRILIDFRYSLRSFYFQSIPDKWFWHQILTTMMSSFIYHCNLNLFLHQFWYLFSLPSIFLSFFYFFIFSILIFVSRLI